MKLKVTSASKFFYLFLITLFITGKLVAQSSIYNENFDASTINLPAGWTQTGGGWLVDSTNNSTGYSNASGLNNVVVKNLSATGVYELISNSISTINYTNISVNWAARVSTNFLSSGSSITGFYWSIDNGISWTNAAYTENGANSVWTIENGGSDVSLPVAVENQASLKLKWVANIVNSTNGTYRIDDLNITGTPDTTSNLPPVVSITSPANNTNYATPPALITIDATASDADGTVTKVEFYNGSTLLGEDLTAPYSYTWTGVAAGSYQIKVKAIDNSNAFTYSSIVNVTVGTSGIPENFSNNNQSLNFNYDINPTAINLEINNSYNADLTIQLYNVLGQEMSSGFTNSNSFAFNAPNLKSGIYFIRVSSSNETSVKKICLIN